MLLMVGFLWACEVIHTVTGVDPPDDSPNEAVTTISTTYMPYGVLDAAYSQTLDATGGDGNYTWAMFNGTTLPAGLSLSAGTGLINGTPTVAGTTNFEVEVASAGSSDTQALSIIIGSTSGSLGQVTDLAVLATTSTSVTLAFTEVAGGAGSPASYNIRYGTPGGGWGGATDVGQGTCASPLSGVAVGATLTCAVEGLTTGTGYDFQLVAFRGTLNVDAVFGQLSNVVTGSPSGGGSAGLTIITTSMPAGTIGSAYSRTLAATGGDGNYTWATFNGTTLPAGLSLNTGTGLINGTPTTPGTTNFEVEVASAGSSDTQALSLSITGSGPDPNYDLTNECDTPHADWIWCDDFETDRLASYFEYDNAGGRFTRDVGVGVNGSTAMRSTFDAGGVGAGNLKLAFGRTPDSYMAPVDAGTADYRDVYWRQYLMNEPGWTGGGGWKLSRAVVFATASWAEAAIGHVWSMGSGHQKIGVDPASGTDEAGNLQTTTYNDFGNMRWLGAGESVTPIFSADRVGQWYCIEVHMRLNDAGSSNGTIELWIDGNFEAEGFFGPNLNFVGSYSDFGINTIMFENYWNGGSPQQQSRYTDNIVISTSRIGCGNGPGPAPPAARP